MASKLTLEQFSDRLDANLGQRKAELQRLSLLIKAADAGSDLRSSLARASILLAYSHWEGFVKEASYLYLDYVNGLGLKHEEIKLVLRAMAMRGFFTKTSLAKKATVHAELLAEAEAALSRSFRADPSKCIDTESNLSSVVFKEIVLSLGLSYLASYELREKYIDRVMGERRHGIAHGELRRMDEEDFDEFFSGVMKLLETYRHQLNEAARLQRYRI